MDYRAVAQSAAQTAGIDPGIFLRMIQQESGFNPAAVSPAGARGIAQFMPGTAADLGIDPDDPEAALYAAAGLLRSHLDRFGSYSLALAAYNAGPGAVEQYGGVPPYAETQQYLSSILGSADAAPRGAIAPRRSSQMVTQQPASNPIDVLLGTAIQQMLFGQADTIAGRGLQAGQLTGYIPGDLLGMSGSLIPSLALRQYESSRQDADRNYEVDLSRFGLQQAEFNYQQRLGQAQVRLQTMAQLASMRGPENAFAYNYALNGLNAPAGTPADPTANIAGGINQPSNITPQRPAGGTGATGAGVPAALPVVPPKVSPPLTQPVAQPPGMNSPDPRNPGGFMDPNADQSAFTGWATTPEEQHAALTNDNPNIPGTGVAEALFAAEQAAGGTPNDMGVGGNITNDDPGQHGIGGYTWEIPSYGRGGMAPGMAVVGDDPHGGDDENEELAIAIDDNLIVLSKQADGKFGISPKTLERFKQQGVEQAGTGALITPNLGDPQAITGLQPSSAVATPLTGEPQSITGLQPNAQVTQNTAPPTSIAPLTPSVLPTGPVTYTPQEMGDSPVFQKLGGTRYNNPNFDLSLPGSGRQVPAYQGLNLARFGRLAPSEQALYKSALETPRAQGGLGLSFLDSLAVAQRHAPRGSGARAGFYGR